MLYYGTPDIPSLNLSIPHLQCFTICIFMAYVDVEDVDDFEIVLEYCHAAITLLLKITVTKVAKRIVQFTIAPLVF